MIKQLFYQLKYYIKHHYIFIIVSNLIQILIIIGFLHAYTYITFQKLNTESYKSIYRIEYDAGCEFNKVNEYLKNININEYNKIQLTFDEKSTIFSYYLNDKIDITVGKYITNKFDAIYTYSYILKDNLEIGNTINILNKEYVISGMRYTASDLISVEIPYASLEDNDIIYSIVLYLNYYPSKNEKSELISSLEDTFKGEVIAPYEFNNKDENDKNTTIILLSILAICLSMINLFYFYSYIIRKERKNNYINYILGMNIKRISILMILKFLIFVIIDLIVGIILWYLLLFPLLNAESSIRFDFSNILVPIFIYLFAFIICFIIGITKFIRKGIKNYEQI